MKANGARQDYFGKVFERPVDFDGRAVVHRAELDQLRAIVSIVIDCADALRDEGRQEFRLFIRTNSAVNAGSEYDRNIRGPNPALDQAPNQQVDDWSAPRCAVCIRNDNQALISPADQILEWR